VNDVVDLIQAIPETQCHQFPVPVLDYIGRQSLSKTAFLLYWEYWSEVAHNDVSVCETPGQVLADRLGVSRQYFQKAKRELVDKHLIVVRATPGGASEVSMHYPFEMVEFIDQQTSWAGVASLKDYILQKAG